MQYSGLRGILSLIPCFGLHLSTLLGRTSAILRAMTGILSDGSERASRLAEDRIDIPDVLFEQLTRIGEDA
jgi:hypothetical protein